MIAFACKHCGVELRVKDSMAGTSGPCPKCSQVVQAPGDSTSSKSGSAASGGQKSGRRTLSIQTIGPHSAGEDTAPPVMEPAPPRDYPFLAPPQQAGELGRLGPYLIRKALGTGAMGVVFQAEDPHLKRLVALKVLKPSLAAFPEYHHRFVREAQLAAALDHDHIVTILQVGEDRGIPYLAMKLLQGQTLEDRLNATTGGLPPEQILRIGREIAEGLAVAHERGLIHRDIKPANIWLETGRDRVKILDFGLACGTEEDGRLTQAGAVIGTPAYMAPEQANAEEVDARCDLFSLGAVLYRACTGERPFAGKDTLSVLSALATKTPKAPHLVVPAVPRGLSDLVMRLLEKDRSRRPQLAREVVDAIEMMECWVEEPAVDEAVEPPPPEEDVPLATLLEEVEPPAPVKEVRPQRSPPKEVVSAPAAPTESRAREAAGPAVKRKRPKKDRVQANQKKAQPEIERNWGRIVLIASLVLWVLAIVVLLLAFLRRGG